MTHPKQSIYQRRYREKYPIKYAYQTLKDNSKRRGKDFDLTYEQFEAFVVRVDYINRKGILADSLHIDRENENLGYTKDNIQPLENAKNVRKFFNHYWDGKEYVFRNEIERNEQKETDKF